MYLHMHTHFCHSHLYAKWLALMGCHGFLLPGYVTRSRKVALPLIVANTSVRRRMEPITEHKEQRPRGKRQRDNKGCLSFKTNIAYIWGFKEENIFVFVVQSVNTGLWRQWSAALCGKEHKTQQHRIVKCGWNQLSQSAGTVIASMEDVDFECMHVWQNMIRLGVRVCLYITLTA